MIEIQQHSQLPVWRQRFEYVERKGLGHPDSICDSVMEAISVALSETYREAAGRVLHHNVDKGLLIAGQTRPRFGGGTVEEPWQLIAAGQATTQLGEKSFPIAEIVTETARRWIGENLPEVDPTAHVIIRNELRPGSAELQRLFRDGPVAANDTSAGVGFAPLTETELIVLEAERFLNSPACQSEFPALGQDVKVMGVRHDRQLDLTAAAAMIGRHLRDCREYFDVKREVCRRLTDHLESMLMRLDGLRVRLNALDDPDAGLEGTYLTVLGTSAECGDDGQVGRGNRVNGLITLHRPMTTEAAAGKNAVCHVGKIYNVLCHRLAAHLSDSVDGIEEATVWMCSRIGRPLSEPQSVTVDLTLAEGVGLCEVRPLIEDCIRTGLEGIDSFTDRLSRGEFPVA